MKKKNLRKVLTVSGIMLVLGITACGKEEPKEEATQITSAIQESSETNTTEEPGDSEKITQEELQRMAEEYLQLLAEGSFEKLSTDFVYDTEVQKAIDNGTLISSLQQIMESFGKLETAQTSVIEEQAPYTVITIPCNFEAQDININIVFTKDGKIAAIQMSDFTGDKKKVETPEGVIEEELALDIGNGKSLPGTLTKPEKEGEYPIVVLVHGSGANDRDESIGPNKPFQDIAWGLAEQGIASYRYDKRTKVYPQDFADPNLGLYEETIEDAASAVQMVKQLENIDTEKVFLLGHSLGGLCIPRINEKVVEETTQEDFVAGYIFFAAPTRKISVMLKEQYDLLFSLVENPDEEQKAQMEEIYKELEKFKQLDTIDDTTKILNVYSAYWKELEYYDMLAEAEKITVPCLVLQGEEDYQVTMEDLNNLKEKFGERENWIFHSYPGLTHLFMKGQKENGGAEYSIKQNVDEVVIQDIIKFITE